MIQNDFVKLPSNKSFGIFFSIILALISIFFFFKNFIFLFVCFVFISIFVLVIMLFNDALLQPLNKLWMRFGLILSKIVNPIILGFLFFLIFTPISILTRVFGRDELYLKYKSEKTFWKSKDKMSKHASFKHQF